MAQGIRCTLSWAHPGTNPRDSWERSPAKPERHGVGDEQVPKQHHSIQRRHRRVDGFHCSGAGTDRIVVPPGTGKVYVSNEASNTVSVLSASNLALLKTIPTGTRPHHMIYDPSGQFVYVTEFGTNQVALIDTRSDTRIAGLPASNSPDARTHGASPGPGGMLYAVSEGTNELAAIDVGTRQIQWTVPIGNRPSEVLVTPDGRTAYVSVRNENKLKVVNLQTRTITGETTVGTQSDTLQLTPDGRTLIVALRGIPAQLAFVDTATLQVTCGRWWDNNRPPMALRRWPIYFCRGRGAGWLGERRRRRQRPAETHNSLSLPRRRAAPWGFLRTPTLSRVQQCQAPIDTKISGGGFRSPPPCFSLRQYQGATTSPTEGRHRRLSKTPLGSSQAKRELAECAVSSEIWTQVAADLYRGRAPLRRFCLFRSGYIDRREPRHWSISAGNVHR